MSNPKRSLSVLLSWFVLLLIGCSNFTASPDPSTTTQGTTRSSTITNQFLYGAGSAAQPVGYQVAADGTLTRLPAHVRIDNIPSAQTPDGHLGFLPRTCPDGSCSEILSFRIHSTGAVQQAFETVLPDSGGDGVSIVVSHSGNFLFASWDGLLGTFSIGNSGKLTLVAHQLLLQTYNQLVLDPTDRDLYGIRFAASDPSVIDQFRVAGDGTVSHAGSFPVADSGFPDCPGSLTMAMHPTGNFIYGNLNSGFCDEDFAVTIGRDVNSGSLSMHLDFPFAGNTSQNDHSMAVNATGTLLLYAGQDGSVSLFTLHQEGSINESFQNLIPTGPAPAILVDGTGRFLFVDDFGNNVVLAFSVSDTGQVSQIGNPISMNTFVALQLITRRR
jgi:hypothetical protein